MKTLRILALVLAVLVGGGEIARRLGTGTFIPLALDELLVSAALLWAAWLGAAAPLAAAFGGLCGLALGLLATTAGEVMLADEEKTGGAFYLTALSLLLLLALWGTWRGLHLARAGR